MKKFLTLECLPTDFDICARKLSEAIASEAWIQLFPKNVERLFPVGRLDYDAEGLILVTNHGNLAQKLMHPSNKVSKGYFVKVYSHYSSILQFYKAKEGCGRLIHPKVSLNI